MDSYVREWLSIQNIVTKKYQQKYLEPLLDNIEDDCTNYSRFNCQSNKHCILYNSISKNESTCVNKNRVRRFQSSETATRIKTFICL